MRSFRLYLCVCVSSSNPLRFCLRLSISFCVVSLCLSLPTPLSLSLYLSSSVCVRLSLSVPMSVSCLPALQHAPCYLQGFADLCVHLSVPMMELADLLCSDDIPSVLRLPCMDCVCQGQRRGGGSWSPCCHPLLPAPCQAGWVDWAPELLGITKHNLGQVLMSHPLPQTQNCCFPG